MKGVPPGGFSWNWASTWI